MTEKPNPEPDSDHERPRTSHDIARLAGVSQATVSRVLQGHQNVSAATRDKVLKVLDDTGFVPNDQARAMRLRRSGSIGILTGRITNPFYPQLLAKLIVALEDSGSKIVLWTNDAESGEHSALEAIRSGSIDGLICTTATESSEALKSAIAQRLPLVLVNRSISSMPCDQVSSDNLTCGADVADFFLRNNRRRLAVIGGDYSITTARDRRQGFAVRARESGAPVSDARNLDCGINYADAYAAGLALFASPDDAPDSIFCINDLVAFGIRDAAESLGYRVPEDLWIVGFDDIEIASWPRMSLSTVRQPISDMTRVALELLERRIKNPESSFQHVQFRESIISRESTAFVKV